MMQLYQDTIQDRNGNVMTGVSVTVKTYPALVTATIYSNNTGTAASNPLTSNTDGQYEFYAVNGTYQITYSKQGVVTETKIITLQDLSGIVSVKGYGAVGDGVTDDTVAVQAAVASGNHIYFPDGSYRLTNGVSCTTPGQMLIGAGKARTKFVIPATFNLSAQGVFIVSGGSGTTEGPQFWQLKIQFTQPDTAVRASLVAFPPAIYAVSQPRFVVSHCLITNAMTGINMTGNSGGALIEYLEISSYTVAIDIDGSLDSVRLNKLHVWNFDLTSNQLSIFTDTTNVGVRSGRCDDFHMSDSLFINGGKQLHLYQSGSGSTFGSVVNTDFDSTASVIISAGKLNIVGCYFTVGTASYIPIDQSGGRVLVDTCEFEGSVTLSNSFVRQSGSVGMYMSLSNCRFEVGGDFSAVTCTTSAAKATMILMGNQFITPQNTVHVNPIISGSTRSRIIAIGNNAIDKGTGTGAFISVTTDDNHVITGNQFMGWQFVGPTTMISPLMCQNASVASDVSNNFVIGNVKQKLFYGSLSAGAATVAHGIAAGGQKVLALQCGYKSGTAWTPLTATMDDTNVNLSGGSGTAAYRIYISYTETQQGW